jgi:hypothetical protein
MKSKKSRIPKDLVSEWSRKTPLYINKDDERYKKHAEQLKTIGFSDSETWSLDSVICKFILPRLIRFKELNNGFPGNLTHEKWDAILDQMIFAFDWSLNCEEDKYDKLTEEEKKTNWLRYEVGMQQFAKYFRDLWW